MNLPKIRRWQVAIVFLIFWVLAWTAFFTSRPQATARDEAMQVAAQSAGFLLAQEMFERSSEIDLLSHSPEMTDESLGSPVLRRMLAMRQGTHDEYLWLGIAGPDGIVRQGTNGVLVGENVAARPWFKAAAMHSYIGDAHEATLLAGRLPALAAHDPARFVDFASPIFSANGHLRGILAAHASWNWIGQSVDARILGALGRDGAEMLVINDRNECIYPLSQLKRKIPPHLGDLKDPAPVIWPDGKTWLTAVGAVKLPSQAQDFNWHVVIRQQAGATPADGDDVWTGRLPAFAIMTVALLIATLFLT